MTILRLMIGDFMLCTVMQINYNWRNYLDLEEITCKLQYLYQYVVDMENRCNDNAVLLLTYLLFRNSRCIRCFLFLPTSNYFSSS